MRTVLVLGAVLAAIVTAVLSTGALDTVVEGNRQADTLRAMGMTCNASLGPTSTGPAGSGALDAAKLTDEQRGTVALIISLGKQRQLPPLAWQVAIQAGMTESGLRSLNYGDRDSLGIFQMRPSMGWGTPTQILDPVYAINTFFDRLLQVPNWKQQRPGDSAQDVERSAFPDRYHKWEAMAAFLIGKEGDVSDPAGCGEGAGDYLLASNAAATAIEFTKEQLGEEYLWGGNGPDQWDCSGILVKAFAAAGVKIPRVANDQYMAGGAYLPVREAKAGDLLFWATNPADPVTVHHVAMYLGNDEYIHAPQTGDVVKISPIAGRPIAGAVRVA
jgi:cell wall-associated NlpC family hydrolase